MSSRLTVIFFIILCFEIGVVLTLAPWWPHGLLGLSDWGNNYFLILASRKLGFGMQRFVASGWMRGAVSGVGILTLGMGLWELINFRLAVRSLDWKWRIVDDAIASGLRNVTWPGRWEPVRVGGRLTILDASHNPEGAEVLNTNLAALVAESGRTPVVICGVLGTERARPLVASICRYAREIYFVVPKQPRACEHAELEALVPADYRGRRVRAKIEEIFPGGDRCNAGGPNDIIVVTGSIYLLGEVMSRLSGKTD